MKINYEKLKKLKEREDKVKQTDRFMNIANFYHQKGLLKFAKTPRIIRARQIEIADNLWAAKYEPRILEVFPAAFIHFKSKFAGIDKMPKNLQHTIDLILKDAPVGPDYKDIKFEDMKRWANIKLKDTRSKPLKEQKKLVSFKFLPEIIEKLDSLANNQNLSKTQVLEYLVKKA